MATPTPSRLRRHILPALPPHPPCASSSSPSPTQGPRRRPASRLHCSSPPVEATPLSGKGGEYRPSFADDLLLAFFRAKMVEEVGWDSPKSGYAGLIEVANRLMIKGKSVLDTEQSAVRVLQALFPPLLLVLFKVLLAPIADGQLASMMVARATSITFMQMADGLMFSEFCDTARWEIVVKWGVREESKCLGICINTCKLSTQFNFGVPPPPLDTDKALNEPCLDICTSARRRREIGSNSGPDGLCPQV